MTPQRRATTDSIPQSVIRLIRRLLPTWYRRHGRELPWRRDRDPYRIWISEVMLQQTQVATVIPFFERFLQAFPTLQTLGQAEEQHVLRSWEGLGYYRRARNLHAGARRLCQEQGGRLPDDPAILKNLPGMGRYTQNAVLSQAFERRVPIVEANSQRVLCRLFGQRGDPRTGPIRRWLWDIAEKLLPTTKVGDFNQALMELGALVCTPAAPRCLACPLAKVCSARQQGLEKLIPPPAKSKEIETISEAAVVIRRGKRVLLVQRPATGQWANLWEFPHSPLAKKKCEDQDVVLMIRDLTNLGIELGPELLTVRHGITRFRITLSCHEATLLSGKFRSEAYQAFKWVLPAELSIYPVSSPQRRLTQALTAPARQRRLF